MSNARLNKLRRLMRRFDSASKFAAARLGGYGAKSANAIVGIIDAASRTRLDLNRVRREVTAHGDWYFLHRVAVSVLDRREHDRVVPSGREDLSRPIVIGSHGEILDGRHRVARAEQEGIRTLPAYVPAEWLYRDLVEGVEENIMSRRLLEERIELLEARRRSDMIEFGHTRSVFQNENELRAWQNDMAKLNIFVGGFGAKSFPLVHDMNKPSSAEKKDRIRKWMKIMFNQSSLFGKHGKNPNRVDKDALSYGVQLPNGQFVGYEYKINRDGVTTWSQAVITAPKEGLPVAGRVGYKEWYREQFLDKDSKHLPAELIHDIDWWLAEGPVKVFRSNKQRAMFRARLAEFGRQLKQDRHVKVTKFNVAKSKDGRWVNKVDLAFDLKGIGYSFQIFVDYNGLKSSYESTGEYTRRGGGEQGYRFH